MKLYQIQNSGNCRRVRAVAAELNIELELIDINPREGEQRKPEYLKINPNAKVPVLVDGDFCLWESHAIMLYLNRQKPDSTLLPSDAAAQADVIRWLFWQTGHLGPAIGKMAFEKIYKIRQGGTFDQKRYDEGMAEFTRWAAVLEQSLGGRKSICQNLSLADFSLASTFNNRDAIDLNLIAYPNILHWLAAVESRDSWKKSAPLAEVSK